MLLVCITGYCLNFSFNISADEQLPAGADNPCMDNLEGSQPVPTVGRSRVNMLKWGYSNEPETCECGIRQTMQYLLVCPMMNIACSIQDLITENGIDISCAMHLKGAI